VWLWKRGRAIGGVWNGWIETPGRHTIEEREKNKWEILFYSMINFYLFQVL
jgi:hypothetical protein